MTSQAPSTIKTCHMYFGLKEQIISFLVKLNREIVSKYCNLSQTQRGIHQLPFMPHDKEGGGGHLTVRFDTKVSRYLEECREVEKKIAEVKDSIKEYIPSEFNTLLFSRSQTFLYLNCGSTSK